MSEPELKLKRRHATVDEEYTLKEVVLAYLSECDNPVPDAVHRRMLRNWLREMVGAPPEPKR